MTRKRAFRVACLAGDGVGPEVMAEASRAIAAVSRDHGFTVDEVHVPFGGEAFARSGHLLPAATRAAYLTADAVLVASTHEPALAGVVAELELQARVAEVRVDVNGTASGPPSVQIAQRAARWPASTALQASVRLVAPLASEASAWAVDRAFRTALARSARLSVVAPDPGFAGLVSVAAARYEGVLVEAAPVADAARRLAFEPEAFDVVVTGAGLGDALAELVGSGTGAERLTAFGLVGEGPGVFAPGAPVTGDDAGHGVANPCSMLLAAAVMLSEGLGQRTAAAALAAALGDTAETVRTPDRVGSGVGSTTREFMEVLLDELPRRVTSFEFSREAHAA